MRAIDFHQSCHSVFVEGTHCCIVICVCVNYLWFSLTKVSSSSFSLSISCFFSSGLVSPFVILSLGRAERDTQTQSESTSQHNLNHGREERPQEHVMTHAELRTLLRKIWFSIHLACLAVKKRKPFTETLIWVIVQYVNLLSESIEQGCGCRPHYSQCFHCD